MRICIVADSNSGHTIRLVSYLAEQKHEVHLICLKKGVDLPDNVQKHELRNFRLPLFREFMWLLQAKKWVQHINPDVLDGHYISVYGFIAAFTGFHPVIITAWGSDLLINPRQNPIWKFTCKYAISHADKIICLFPLEIAKEAFVNLKADLSKVETYYLGVDINLFRHLDSGIDDKANFGISPKSPIVINVRGLAPVYDIDTFLKAMPIVLKAIPQAEFIVMYNIQEKNTAHRFREQFQHIKNLKFIENIPHSQMPRLLSMANVYVSTSISDGASNALFEAMACELSTIVTDIPANKYWIIDGENGLLFKPFDYEVLAKKLIFLLQNKQLQQLFGIRSRKIIIEKAEQNVQMANIERIYQKLSRNVCKT